MRLNQRAENIVLPLGAVVLALLIGAVMIRLNGSNPWTAYTALVDGALGSKEDVARTLARTTPLIFTGLAVIIGLKAGLFNIGAQGQLIFGATFAAWVGYEFTGLPAVLHVPFAIVVGGIFGMLPAALAGVLKAYRGAHEVITTIMLNAILINLTEYLVGARGPFHDPDAGAQSRTPLIQPSAEIPEVWRSPARVRPRRAGRRDHVVPGLPHHDRVPHHDGRAEQAGGRVRRHLRRPHHRAGDGPQRLPRRRRRGDPDPGRVPPLRGRLQRRPRVRRHHRRPAGPGPAAAGHPRSAAPRDHARRPDRRCRSGPTCPRRSST